MHGDCDVSLTVGWDARAVLFRLTARAGGECDERLDCGGALRERLAA